MLEITAYLSTCSTGSLLSAVYKTVEHIALP